MVRIVVAKYNENLDWIKKVTHNITIYDNGVNKLFIDNI